MDIWVDTESGTYGLNDDSLVFIWLSPSEEEVFAELSDNDRCEIALRMSRGDEWDEVLADLGIDPSA